MPIDDTLISSPYRSRRRRRIPKPPWMTRVRKSKFPRNSEVTLTAGHVCVGTDTPAGYTYETGSEGVVTYTDTAMRVQVIMRNPYGRISVPEDSGVLALVPTNEGD